MSTPVSLQLFIAQYEALRAEIHQRLDQRQQLLTYALIGAASFFSVGLQSWASAVTVLCYPVLAFFLACAWAQHDTRIGQITIYLRAIEDRHLEAFAPGWEQFRRSTFTRKRRTLSDSVSLPARGLFVGSQVLALVIGLARFSSEAPMTVVFVVLLLLDCVVMLLTIVVLSHRRARLVEKGSLQ